MDMDWVNVKEKLPPINTIVRVKVANAYEAFDFVNEPLDLETPFQHYIVKEWRYATRDELNDLLKKVVQ